jgi:hypothetical protein
MAKLNNQGVNSTAIHPNLRGYLYKIFVRPTIMYGIENYQLNTYEEQAIARIEGNAIKRMMNVSNRCRTKKLISACKMDTTRNRIKNQKLSFTLRLLENKYTMSLLKSLKEEKCQDQGNFYSEIVNSRFYIQICAKLGLSCQDIYKEQKSSIPSMAPSMSTIQRGFMHFELGKNSLEDQHWSGRPHMMKSKLRRR